MQEDQHPAALFLRDLFGPVTSDPIFLTSLDNSKDGAGQAPRQVVSRDMTDITRVCRKWDRPGRGLFFCVGTLRGGTTRRAKDNISEIIGLHADIDFKAIDPAIDALARLDGLRLLPSKVVASGHGLHGYWLFREAIPATPEAIARVEAMLRQLCDLVGGDPQVCEVARLMRLPGTHNTKDDGSIEVTIVRDRAAARYELDELEEWLAEASPVIHRLDVPAPARGATTSNPFLAIASRLGFKPPVDVEQRLAVMTYQGPGEAGIHATQLSVSAALLSRGTPIDEVVELLCEATRVAAGPFGARWNWGREDKAIRRMCEVWLAKNPVAKEAVARPARNSARAAASAGTDTGPAVVQLKEERARRAPPAKAPPPDKKSLHIVLGATVIEVIRGRGDDLMFTPKGAYRYSDGLWRMEVDGLKAWLDVEIETAARGLGMRSANRLVAEARQWIIRNPELWVEEVSWDGHGLVPARGAMIDPLTLAVTVPGPDHYATWRVEANYDPTADCPWWRLLLDDVFADREEGPERDKLIGLIQEMLGAALVDIKPRALSKALLLQGGSNFGKSVVLEVLAGLFGPDHISTSLEALEGAHGLVRFVRRLPWVLHEAFDQRKWHLSSTVKAIITGEPVNINIKNGPMLSTRVRVPVFWATNHPPQFQEATKAIVNRLIVIACRQEFFSEAPVGAAREAARLGLPGPATLVLERELPGLLNWALEGLARALARGFFDQPQEVLDTAEEIRRDTNLVAGFLEDCVDFDPNRRVLVADFCAAYSVWYAQSISENRNTPSNVAIGKALAAMGDRRIAMHRKDTRDKSSRYYAGVKLNAEGLKFWKHALEAKSFEGKTAGTTATGGEVNSVIPESWNSRPAIRNMRLLQGVEGTPKDRSTEKRPLVTSPSNASVTDNDRSHTTVTSEVPGKSREPIF